MYFKEVPPGLSLLSLLSMVGRVKCFRVGRGMFSHRSWSKLSVNRSHFSFFCFYFYWRPVFSRDTYSDFAQQVRTAMKCYKDELSTAKLDFHGCQCMLKGINVQFNGLYGLCRLPTPVLVRCRPDFVETLHLCLSTPMGLPHRIRLAIYCNTIIMIHLKF